MATCWTGGDVRCKKCKGETKKAGDEYGGLVGGGDYQRFECIDPKCGETTYIELPD